MTHGGFSGKIYAIYYDSNLGYYYVFEMCEYRIGTIWRNIPESLAALKEVLYLKEGIMRTLNVVSEVKNVALQTTPTQLFSIDDFPKTTPTPQAKKRYGVL